MQGRVLGRKIDSNSKLKVSAKENAEFNSRGEGNFGESQDPETAGEAVRNSHWASSRDKLQIWWLVSDVKRKQTWGVFPLQKWSVCFGSHISTGSHTGSYLRGQGYRWTELLLMQFHSWTASS